MPTNLPDLPFRPGSPSEAATLYLNAQREVLRLEAELHHATALGKVTSIGPTLALLQQARRQRDAAKRCYDDFYPPRSVKRSETSGA